MSRKAQTARLNQTATGFLNLFKNPASDRTDRTMLSNACTSIISRAQRHVVRCALHATLGGALDWNARLVKSRETIQQSANLGRDSRITVQVVFYCEQSRVYYGEHVLRIWRESTFLFSFRSCLLAVGLFRDVRFITFIAKQKRRTFSILQTLSVSDSYLRNVSCPAPRVRTLRTAHALKIRSVR